MKLNVGDFLIRKEGDVTAIAVIEERYKTDEYYDVAEEFHPKEEYYDLMLIDSTGNSYEECRHDYELESEGWTKLEV